MKDVRKTPWIEISTIQISLMTLLGAYFSQRKQSRHHVHLQRTEGDVEWSIRHISHTYAVVQLRLRYTENYG